MPGIVTSNILDVYEELKDRYDLVLTTTSALDEGFTVESPVIVGKAHGQIIELYVADEMFVLDVMDDDKTNATHWHPYNVNNAIRDIISFMEGK